MIVFYDYILCNMLFKFENILYLCTPAASGYFTVYEVTSEDTVCLTCAAVFSLKIVVIAASLLTFIEEDSSMWLGFVVSEFEAQ
jgi:hypothetical protein